MSNLIDLGKSDSIASIVPIVSIEEKKARCQGRSALKLGEYKIAKRIMNADFRSSTVFEPHSTFHYDSQEKNGIRNRLNAAWQLMSELVSFHPKGPFQSQLDLLLHCLDVLKQRDEERDVLRAYIDRLQLYSMMPFYLNLDSRDPSSTIETSITLAREAVALIDLDRLLGYELFELLSQPEYVDHPPCIALQKSLKIGIAEVVLELNGLVAKSIRTKECLSLQRPATDYCEGYWSIVQQWMQRAVHLRIPPKLSIGKIVWPKVQDHWSRLSQALLDQSEIQETASPLFDVVEIRSSNDPQLALTLDTHLQRCREQDGSMALVVIRELRPSGSGQATPTTTGLLEWQSVIIQQVCELTGGSTTRGFIYEAGELSLIVDDMDRSEVTATLREILEVACQPKELVSTMIEMPKLPLVCGVSCVTSPSKSFKIDQLISAAWRCLDAAKMQGAGAVKSLEVY